MDKRRLDWVLSGLCKYALTEKQTNSIRLAVRSFDLTGKLSLSCEKMLEKLYKEKSMKNPDVDTYGEKKFIDFSFDSDAEYKNNVKHQRKDVSDLIDLFLSREIDFKFFQTHIPRMIWFNDMISAKINSSSGCVNHQEDWSTEDSKRLREKWNKIGDSTFKIWNDIANVEFGRTMYSIEMQLRFFIVSELNQDVYEKILELRTKEV